MIKNLAISAVLLLVGCSTGAITPQEALQGKAKLQECLSAAGIYEMRSTCFRTSLKDAGPDAYDIAEAHWDAAVAKMGPDERLLAHILWKDVDAARAAIASGANINHPFSNRIVYGPNANDPHMTQPPLAIAIREFQLDLVELLLSEGADPNWRPDGKMDMFTGGIRASASFSSVDGTYKKVTGLQLAELGVKYGLTPTAHTLKQLENYISIYNPQVISHEDYRPIYQELLQRATPKVKQELAALYIEEKRKLAAESADRERQYAQQAARLEKERQESEAIRQKNVDSLRTVGTRICKEQPGDMGTLVYIGYVEGVAPEKIQIRVSNAIYKGTSLSPGGFRESIIWDYPNTWYRCE